MKKWYIHYLLDLLTNLTQFQLKWIRTKKFWLKLINIALTLKYCYCHWKWYEQVKLNKRYDYAKSDLYHIYGVWVNPNIKASNKPRHLTYEKHVNDLPWVHPIVTQSIFCIIFSMYVTTIQHLNWVKQESKKHYFHLCFWHSHDLETGHQHRTNW